jgi:hypothetical protein
MRGENMLNRLLLIILKQRLKRYKRDANWYDEQGIPDLEKEINKLETMIKGCE